MQLRRQVLLFDGRFSMLPQQCAFYATLYNVEVYATLCGQLQNDFARADAQFPHR